MDYPNYKQMAAAQQQSAYNGPKDIEPESASPIRDSVTASEQILSELHNVIDQFEKRLDTVLLPVPPQGAGTSGAVPTPATSHVRGRLLILNEGYIHAAARLRDLIRRVEV